MSGKHAARVTDLTASGGVLVGLLAPTVFINCRPSATVQSVGIHSNGVITGSGTVIIESSHTPAPFLPPLRLLLLPNGRGKN